MSAQIGTVAGIAVALYAAHPVADYWVQTTYQARAKGEPGWFGRWNCAKHVASYTLTCVAALAALAAVTGWHPHAGPLLAGLAVNAVTHYAADRRRPLRRLALAVGRGEFYDLGGGACLGAGAHALDQSFHGAALFATALIIAI